MDQGEVLAPGPALSPASGSMTAMGQHMRFASADETAFRRRQKQLLDDYAQWLPEPVNTGVDPDDFGMLLTWKWSCDGDLGLWHRRDLDEFLLAWCPRHAQTAAPYLRTVPIAVAMGMSFLSERGLLHGDSDTVDDLVAHVLDVIDDFERAMSDPSNFGMTKSIFAAMGIDDPTELDGDQLQQVMDDFNALSYDERKAITDPSMAETNGPSLGPVRMPSRSAVHASAAAAPVLIAFETIADYLAAPGKALTARGNLKLADAQALAEAIGTGELVEEDVGGRTFHRKSSTQFVVLDHLQWWAREVGAIRRRNNRLVGVKAWQQRARNNSVGELSRAFTVLLEYGCLASFTGHFGPIDEWLDDAVPSMLARLLDEGRALEYDDLQAAYLDATQHDGLAELYPGQLGRALDRQLAMLERAGVLTQRGAVHRPGELVGDDRSGGQIALTPAGVHIAVEVLQRYGVDIACIPPAEEMTPDELAGLVNVASLDPEEWWRLVEDWSGTRPSRGAAFTELVQYLADTDPLRLALAVGVTPSDLTQWLEPPLRALLYGPVHSETVVGSVALNWLVTKELLDIHSIPPERVLDSMIDIFTVDGDDGEAVRLLSEGRTVQEQLELIGAVASRDRGGTAPLLDALGRLHPDKAVSKAARKELFRVRSRNAR